MDDGAIERKRLAFGGDANDPAALRAWAATVAKDYLATPPIGT